MNVYIVKTGDGPVYFRGDRNAYKYKAIDLAYDMVMVLDSLRYSGKDTENVKAAKAKGYGPLEKALRDCYALDVQPLLTERPL